MGSFNVFPTRIGTMNLDLDHLRQTLLPLPFRRFRRGRVGVRGRRASIRVESTVNRLNRLSLA